MNDQRTLDRACAAGELVGVVQAMLFMGLIHPKHVDRCTQLVNRWNDSFTPPPEVAEQVAARKAQRQAMGRAA